MISANSNRRRKGYLAGGINGLSDAAAKDWRAQFKALVPECDFLDPMVRDYRGVEDANVNDIVLNDLKDINSADIIVINATKPSWGTAMEVVYAWQAVKRTVAFVGGSAISPWLRYHVDHVVNTVEEAAALVRAFAEEDRGNL